MLDESFFVIRSKFALIELHFKKTIAHNNLFYYIDTEADSGVKYILKLKGGVRYECRSI